MGAGYSPQPRQILAGAVAWLYRRENAQKTLSRNKIREAFALFVPFFPA
jgi:hypothetical protein